MKASREEVKNAILFFAEKYGQEKNYQALMEVYPATPKIVEMIVYEMFLNNFNPYFSEDKDYDNYRIIFEYTTELKKVGCVEHNQTPSIMKTIKFYKEPDDRWYADLPEWEGSQAELEMVLGADTLLNNLTSDDQIVITFSTQDFTDSSKLNFVKLNLDIENGAFYKYLEMDLELWLCDVTKFVFGYFPETIYFKKMS